MGAQVKACQSKSDEYEGLVDPPKFILVFVKSIRIHLIFSYERN